MATDDATAGRSTALLDTRRVPTAIGNEGVLAAWMLGALALAAGSALSTRSGTADERDTD